MDEAHHDGDKWCWDAHVAAQLGDMHVLQFTTSKETVSQNRRGWSPVMYASAAGQHESLLALLTAAGNQDEGREARIQAVNTAVHYNNPDMLAFLTERGLVGADEKGAGLLLAAELGHVGMARELLERGSDINTIDAEGNTALSIAVAHRNTELTFLLFSAKLQSNSEGSVESSWEEVEQSGDVVRFCYELILGMDSYLPDEALRRFLEAAKVRELWPLFQHEEIDFGVLLYMDDNDLSLIGVHSKEARKIILEEKTNVTNYFEQLFGTKATAKLFKFE